MPGATQVDAAEQRFTLLYDTHYSTILAYLARRLDSVSVAQDLTEDVFLIVWDKLDQVPVDEEALYWLYAVAKRVLSNHRRTSARRLRIGAAFLRAPAPLDDGTAEQVVRDAEAETVHRALGRLKETDQELIRLAYWDELPHAAIGQMLGCSRSAVDVRLHRARRRLRKALARSRHIPVEGLAKGAPEENQWRPTIT